MWGGCAMCLFHIWTLMYPAICNSVEILAAGSLWHTYWRSQTMTGQGRQGTWIWKCCKLWYLAMLMKRSVTRLCVSVVLDCSGSQPKGNYLWHTKFSQLHCWRCKSCGLWHCCCVNKGKGKTFSLEQVTKAQRGSRCISALFLQSQH